jgi:hypothetical protein
LNFKKQKVQSEQSTHFQTARLPQNEGLSYTFRVFHDRVKKSKIESNNYIFDLDNTMNINLEMIENILSSINLNKENKKKLSEKIKKIKELFKKKQNLKKNKNQCQSKILLQNQILEETKRGKEENLNYLDEKTEELIIGLDKKLMTIKKLQKKFDEVQTYIQRECLYFKKWKRKYEDFEIIPFILKNENYLITHKNLLNEIKILTNQFYVVSKENYYYGIKTTQNNNEEKEEIDFKLKDLIKILLSKNIIIQNKINKLKKVLNKPISIYRINKIIDNHTNQNNLNMNDEVRTLINVSLLNNSKATEFLNVNNITKISNNFDWDISCIDKNDYL